MAGRRRVGRCADGMAFEAKYPTTTTSATMNRTAKIRWPIAAADAMVGSVGARLPRRDSYRGRVTRLEERAPETVWTRIRARAAAIKARIEALRARVRARPGGRTAWRVGATLVGLVIIAGGIVLLPLPGPGWVIIFAGLGVLATEYPWAARLLTWLRDQVQRWTHWIARQSRPVQVATAVGGVVLLVVIVGGVYYLYRRI